MQVEQPSNILSFFTMLADPVRLKILQTLLNDGETSVSKLINEVRRSQTMISYHLSCLKECGLVMAKKSSKDARIMLYTLHEPEVVEKMFLLAENFLLKHEVCKNHPSCQLINK